MKCHWVVLLLATIMVYGEEAKPKTNKNQGHAANAVEESRDNSGGHVVVFYENKSDGQSDKHQAKTPNYFYRLFGPENLSNWALVIVAGITGYFIAKQAIETTKATRAMQESVDVMKAKERARLLVDVFLPMGNIFSSMDTIPFITLTMKVWHYGPSDAFNVRAFGEAKATDSADDRPPIPMDYDLNIPNVITPGSEFVIFDIHSACDESLVTEINNKKKFFHLYGQVIYEDIFDKTHISPFRYVWKVDGFQIAPEAPWEDTSMWVKVGIEENRAT